MLKSLLLLGAATHALAAESPNESGMPAKLIKLVDEDIGLKLCMDFAKNYFSEKMPGQSLGDLLAVSKQVVAGMNYDMTFKIVNSQKCYKIKVFDQPWTKTRQATQEAEIDCLKLQDLKPVNNGVPPPAPMLGGKQTIFISPQINPVLGKTATDKDDKVAPSMSSQVEKMNSKSASKSDESKSDENGDDDDDDEDEDEEEYEDGDEYQGEEEDGETQNINTPTSALLMRGAPMQLNFGGPSIMGQSAPHGVKADEPVQNEVWSPIHSSDRSLRFEENSGMIVQPDFHYDQKDEAWLRRTRRQYRKFMRKFQKSQFYHKAMYYMQLGQRWGPIYH